MTKVSGPTLPMRVLRIAAATLAALVLVAVFYLAVVLGQPQPSENEVKVKQDQPLLTASPAKSITAEDQLGTLIEDYPAPVMSFLAGAGPTFQSGLSYDAVFDGGFGRIVELTYRLSSGDAIKVQTIYPARALSLVPRGDYRLTTAATQALAGLRAIRMESDAAIRLHAQGTDALYVLTVPQMTQDELTALTKSLQLFTTTKKDT